MKARDGGTRDLVLELWSGRLTSTEIAAILGITRGCVTVHVCNGRDEGDPRAVCRRRKRRAGA